MIFKRTKILATVGPAVNNYEALEKLMLAGVNGFRLNFSHGSHEERNHQIAWIRELSKEHSKPVAILQDLQGPKIRLGMLKDDQPLDVKEGDELVLDSECEHDGSLTLPVQYNLAEKVKPGERVFIFDGKIRTTVMSVESESAIRLKVENNGTLMSKKGLNVPDTDFGGDILTEKDYQDIEYGSHQDIDFVALSFVQSAEDINTLRQRLVELGSDAHIIAKIETRAAIEHDTLKAIVKASDGVMVARGDLAVEAGAEIVPVIQRKIIAMCRKYGKLSIVATQMMASMVDHPEPTRAEVSDVGTAVILGADAVMLSDETANGSYPVETVMAMKRTIIYTQEHSQVDKIDDTLTEKITRRNSIAAAAVGLAERLEAGAIVAETKTGLTAVSVAAFRPNLPIVSVTDQRRTAQQLALSYASKSFLYPASEHAGYEMTKKIYDEGYFQTDRPITTVIVSGQHPGVTNETDTIRVRVIE